MNSGYELDPTAPAVVALQESYVADSHDAARLPGARLDLSYGAEPCHKLDIFPAGPKDPVLVFIHGGYWKAGSKDARRFPALAWAKRNVSWVCLNYRLLPHATLAEAVEDARSAILWLAKNGHMHGIDPEQIHITGNSAGGHLAAMIASEGWTDRPPIKSLIAISGIFDLEPILETDAKDWLKLTLSMAQSLSPIRNPPPNGLPVLLGCGGAEPDAFRFRMEIFAETCRRAECPTQTFESPGADHFQIIGEYGRTGTALFDRLLKHLR
jgi:arylformamidase